MASVAANSAESSTERPKLRGRRVLLVDDDPVLLRTWSRTLERSGMIVRAVSKISEARATLAFWHRRKFDYALVDDRLPDGFGLDLVPMLAELRPAPSYVVVSALPSTERALRAWQNAVVIVPKPVSPSGLLELLGFLDSQRKPRRLRYRRTNHVVEAIRFGRFVLDADGLHCKHAQIRLTTVARELLAELAHHRGTWVPTVQLARELYEMEDTQSMMLVRRQISHLRRALGEQRWIVESALQRGYRLAPEALRELTPEASSEPDDIAESEITRESPVLRPPDTT
jgi:two-component system OmpR family response regulator